jgi:hypothetical protein
MATININFNNTEYSINESSLTPTMNELKSHLSTVMNGMGAVVNFDETDYNIDSVKLSAAKDDLISHLGTIIGSGSKIIVDGVEHSVDSTKIAEALSELETAFDSLSEERLEGDGAEFYTLAPSSLSFRSTAPLNELEEVQINGVTVDPSNYSLEEGSTIVTFPIDYLKTLEVGDYEVNIASESKSVKGNFTVAAPKLNEHGFYYNQPYIANVAALGSDYVMFFREDNTMDLIRLTNGDVETCSYVISDNVLSASTSIGTINSTLSSDGTEIFCTELGASAVLGDESVVADKDYIYIYNEDLGGYEVQCIDETKVEYGAIKTGINEYPTVALKRGAFYGNINLVNAPEIPDTVSTIGDATFNGRTSLTSIIIPASVEQLDGENFTFCTSLVSVVFAEGSKLTTIGYATFNGCTSLTSIIIPDSVTYIASSVFYGCTRLMNITFEGTVEQWNAISKDISWNLKLPATHVQCSDGTVEL